MGVQGSAMTLNRPIRVGSRGSPLALIQDEEALSNSGRAIRAWSSRWSLCGPVATPTRPLRWPGMGLGVFVSQIEERLLSGDLDMAIHSLKDLPTKLPEGLTLGAILQRRDPRDVLVNRWNCRMSELPEGTRIGTSSPAPRRAVAPLRSRASGWCPYEETWRPGCARPKAKRLTALCWRLPDWFALAWRAGCQTTSQRSGSCLRRARGHWQWRCGRTTGGCWNSWNALNIRPPGSK